MIITFINVYAFFLSLYFISLLNVSKFMIIIIFIMFYVMFLNKNVIMQWSDVMRNVTQEMRLPRNVA